MSCCESSKVNSSCREGAGAQQAVSTDLEWVSRLRLVHGRRAATSLVLDLGVSVQVRPAIHDLDVLEAGGKHGFAVIVDL